MQRGASRGGWSDLRRSTQEGEDRGPSRCSEILTLALSRHLACDLDVLQRVQFGMQWTNKSGDEVGCQTHAGFWITAHSRLEHFDRVNALQRANILPVDDFLQSGCQIVPQAVKRSVHKRQRSPQSLCATSRSTHFF